MWRGGIILFSMPTAGAVLFLLFGSWQWQIPYQHTLTMAPVDVYTVEEPVYRGGLSTFPELTAYLESPTVLGRLKGELSGFRVVSTWTDSNVHIIARPLGKGVFVEFDGPMPGVKRWSLLSSGAGLDTDGFRRLERRLTEVLQKEIQDFTKRQGLGSTLDGPSNMSRGHQWTRRPNDALLHAVAIARSSFGLRRWRRRVICPFLAKSSREIKLVLPNGSLWKLSRTALGRCEAPVPAGRTDRWHPDE